MDDPKRLSDIQRKIEEKEYLMPTHPKGATLDDLQFLLEQVKLKEAKIQQLERKTKVLAQQNLELTAEMENMRSDFGGDFR